MHQYGLYSAQSDLSEIKKRNVTTKARNVENTKNNIYFFVLSFFRVFVIGFCYNMQFTNFNFQYSIRDTPWLLFASSILPRMLWQDF
jgi:hypothetical protein